MTEVGRQPYVIYGLLKTKDALSPIIPEAVFGSLIGFMVIYALMLFSFLYYCSKLSVKALKLLSSPKDEAEETKWLHVATHTTHLTEDPLGE